jgi:Holliday junction resolvase RusA-like endonuclease
VITLSIQGPPVGKQRARVTRTGHAYTPAKTVNYEALVKQTFAAKYPDFVPMAGPARMTLSIWLMESKETQRKLRRGINVYPTIKPDISNVLKSIEDALNGLAYVDDKQLVWVEVVKAYSNKPRVEVIVKELP